MWAANYDGNTVVEFTKAQLAKSGSVTPRVTISSKGIMDPGDVAFNSSGDLWVPKCGHQRVVRVQQGPAGQVRLAGPAKGLLPAAPQG